MLLHIPSSRYTRLVLYIHIGIRSLAFNKILSYTLLSSFLNLLLSHDFFLTTVALSLQDAANVVTLIDLEL